MKIGGLRIFIFITMILIPCTSQAEEEARKNLRWDAGDPIFVSSEGGSELAIRCPPVTERCRFELLAPGQDCKQSKTYKWTLVSDKGNQDIQVTCLDASERLLLEPYGSIEDLVRKANYVQLEIPTEKNESYSAKFELAGSSAAIELVKEYRSRPHCKKIPDQKLSSIKSRFPAYLRPDKKFTFSELYPTPFHDTDEFNYLLIGGSMAAAAAITYATAGVGAPAVIPGTSALIVAVGGGSQGAYMAGLSTIGSLVGSNAIGGAAVLNGLGAAVGLSATAKNAAVFGIALKSMTGIGLAAYDGILIAEDKKTGDLILVSELRMPEEIDGSDYVKSLAKSIKNNEKKIAEASKENDLISARAYLEYRKADLSNAVELLECILLTEKFGQSEVTPEDLILLSIMAHKAGDFDAFHQAVKVLEKSRGKYENTSFIDYLIASSYFTQGQLDQGAKSLQSSIGAEPGIPEPTTLQLVYLSRDGEAFAQNESRMSSLIGLLEKDFNEDRYNSPHTKASVYFRLGTIYLRYDRPAKAIRYFEKARENLSAIQEMEVFARFVEQNFKNDIDVYIAISYAKDGKVTVAEKKMNALLDSLKEDDERRKVYRKQYDDSV
ncbi:hypothetical protein EYC98_21305 [Halieaceae bacterium IMCC14734]|uniref:Tetratricopeptide repeat protein n=1 Tax=Candidatus Litorirhabdus singularis TaxID=2518993 RepID=A0ABT3TNR2_9GAMM|nr:hypothetical protein [Candidatus Litorirhabdus singularis]MCX2983405.1 hypothetical protein [Candidatus Litorirhabdus singularis]